MPMRSLRTLTLSGPPLGDADAALAAVRQALPAGFTLEE